MRYEISKTNECERCEIEKSAYCVDLIELAPRRRAQRACRGGPTASAQLSQVNTLLITIQNTLLGVGGVVCSISIIWAGFKMMFQHARFGDIAHVFIGGLFVGCATVIAGMLIPTA